MDEKRTQPEFGQLPQNGNLAVSYIPMQFPQSPKYNANEGLKNGTLYPGLNLPLRGYAPDKEVSNTPMGQIMALGFALQELGLYLDTHPDDREALTLRNNFVRMLQDATAAYEKTNGPITQNTVMTDKYSWIQNPWPWEVR